MDTQATSNTIDHLLATLADGTTGFNDGAGKLDDIDRGDLSAQFRALALQRSDFHQELKSISLGLGHETDDDGTITAKLHRGWMSIKDAIADDNPTGVLQVAEQGEAHALSVYETACKAELPKELHTVVLRQFGDVQTAHTKVARLLEVAENLK
jgi:uncharacterized protein (TIGR02284 family)